MQHGHLVLLDTSIIIEAFRTDCWKAITSYFRVETVEKCYEEALTGDPLRTNHIPIDADALRGGLRARHGVSNRERAKLILRLPAADALDPGEQALFAYAFALGQEEWLASAADRAALKVALQLNWEDRLASLEALARAAGARPVLRHHFTEAWLSGCRTDHKLAIL